MKEMTLKMKCKCGAMMNVCPRCNKKVIGFPVNSKICSNCLEQEDLLIRLEEE
jgi:hypothetical protein